MKWVYLNCTYFTCALDINNKEIITAAPAICKWTIGKNLKEVIRYYKNRNAYIKHIILEDAS